MDGVYSNIPNENWIEVDEPTADQLTDYIYHYLKRNYGDGIGYYTKNNDLFLVDKRRLVTDRREKPMGNIYAHVEALAAAGLK